MMLSHVQRPEAKTACCAQPHDGESSLIVTLCSGQAPSALESTSAAQFSYASVKYLVAKVPS